MVAKTDAVSASVSANGNEWLDIPEESQLTFESVGEEFIGQFLGWGETKTGIVQAHFENADGAFFTNCGESLKRQLKKIQVGWLVRISYSGDLDTGQASPMKQFRVQYKTR